MCENAVARGEVRGTEAREYEMKGGGSLLFVAAREASIRAPTFNSFLDLDLSADSKRSLTAPALSFSLSFSNSFSLSFSLSPLPLSPLTARPFSHRSPPTTEKQKYKAREEARNLRKMRSLSPLKAAALVGAVAFLLSGSLAAATFPGFNATSVAAAKSAAEVRVRIFFLIAREEKEGKDKEAEQRQRERERARRWKS